ncbi:MAG: hypothetical protein F4X54_07575 [Chloroflexi bacterium]|nr:hypothetical protein [Chloroflexota bacterium]
MKTRRVLLLLLAGFILAGIALMAYGSDAGILMLLAYAFVWYLVWLGRKSVKLGRWIGRRMKRDG